MDVFAQHAPVYAEAGLPTFPVDPRSKKPAVKPTIRADALEMGCGRVAEAAREGQRNDTLWRWCMVQARFCDDVDAQIDAAQTWASGMPIPLNPREVVRTARSAWSYETRGKNFVGLRRPQITWTDNAIDDLMDEPDAFVLLQIFQRYHAKKRAFNISPTAMAREKNPPWHRSRIEHARDVLIARGYLAVVREPDALRRLASVYRLTMPESDNNHYTSLSPAWGQEETAI